tara:strand:- start:1598 stop:1741 length:144 start_codon:yes stop_codon:yes gene_type:complete
MDIPTLKRLLAIYEDMLLENTEEALDALEKLLTQKYSILQDQQNYEK